MLTSIRKINLHWPAAIRRCIPLVAGMFALCTAAGSAVPKIPGGPAVDAKVHDIMIRTHANGMAVAVMANGEVQFVHAYGIRNAAGQPLKEDTVMYGASLTKIVFAYTVLQLVDQGRIKLDTPIKDDLDRPLPTYGRTPCSRTSTVPTGTWPATLAGRGSRPGCASPIQRDSATFGSSSPTGSYTSTSSLARISATRARE